MKHCKNEVIHKKVVLSLFGLVEIIIYTLYSLECGNDSGHCWCVLRLSTDKKRRTCVVVQSFTQNLG